MRCLLMTEQKCNAQIVLLRLYGPLFDRAIGKNNLQ